MSAIDFATQRLLAAQLEHIAWLLGADVFDTSQSFRIVLMLSDSLEVAVDAQPALGVLYVSIPSHDIAVAVHGNHPMRLVKMVNRELRKCVARPDRVVVLEQGSNERRIVLQHDFTVKLENCIEAAKIAESLASRSVRALNTSLVI